MPRVLGGRSGGTREPATRGGPRDVEGLRALAILGVVLFHTRLGVLPGGFVGVDVFFVLSGFLITGLLRRDLERSCCPPLRTGVVVRDAVAAALYVANYRFAVEQTDYLASPSAPSPVEHCWSLGVEEQFSLFWPLLLALVVVRRRRRGPAAPARGVALAVVGVVAAASFALSSWLTSVAQPWAFFSLPSRAWELAAGAVVALALPWLTRLPRRVAVVLGWSGLAAVGLSFGLSFLAIRPGVAFPGLVPASRSSAR